MKNYSYKAIDKNGEFEKGKISASSPSELASILASKGLEVISYKAQSEFLTLTSDKIKTKDIITMFIHLEQLDKAGVPIIDSIADLKDTSDSKALQNLMQEIYESIRDGSLFSEALAKHPENFSSVYVGLIANGEETGNLSESFANIVDDLKWNIEFKRKIRKASVGPSFAIFLMTLIIGVMMGVVVPKVTGFLTLQEVKIPPATQSLIVTSEFVKRNWLTLLLFIPSIIAFFKIGDKIPAFRSKLDYFKVKLPIIGPILVKLDAARFCQFFSMSFKSGIGVLECLDSAAKVIKNSAIQSSIQNLKLQVSEGSSLGKAIAANPFFPNLVTRMFRVGEESGNMEEALKNIKFFYDREINDSIDRLVGMIQPSLTIIMGALITWVIVGVFGPIYGSFSKIK